MPPFNGQKKTPNTAFDPSKDNVCPNLRSMSMKDMKSTTALAGQTGNHCKLVHGDRWQHIDGSMTEVIGKNLKTDILVNETWEVHNNLVFRVDGTTTDDRVGVHHQTNWNPRFDHFVHTRTENHNQREVINQPTENVNWFQKITEFVWEKHATQIFYFVGNLFKFEVDGTEASAKGVQVQRILISNKNELTKTTFRGVKFETGGPVSRIVAARVTAAPVHVEAEPTANAGPVAEIGAPHI